MEWVGGRECTKGVYACGNGRTQARQKQSPPASTPPPSPPSPWLGQHEEMQQRNGGWASIQGGMPASVIHLSAAGEETACARQAPAGRSLHKRVTLLAPFQHFTVIPTPPPPPHPHTTLTHLAHHCTPPISQGRPQSRVPSAWSPAPAASNLQLGTPIQPQPSHTKDARMLPRLLPLLLLLAAVALLLHRPTHAADAKKPHPHQGVLEVSTSQSKSILPVPAQSVKKTHAPPPSSSTLHT